jgi:hypothetical protein
MARSKICTSGLAGGVGGGIVCIFPGGKGTKGGKMKGKVDILSKKLCGQHICNIKPRRRNCNK